MNLLYKYAKQKLYKVNSTLAVFSFMKLYNYDFFNLSYREKSNYVGATFQGKMCESQYGGGIALVGMV